MNLLIIFDTQKIIFPTLLYILLAHLAENEQIREVYWNIEKTCRKTTKLMFNYVVIQQQILLAALVYSIYGICTGNMDTETWPLVFNFAIPFPTKTLWGWYSMWAYQLASSLSYTVSTISTTSYFMCCCYYIIASCNHFKLLIRSISGSVDQYKKEPNLRTQGEISRKIKRQLFEAVKLHNTILEWVKDGIFLLFRWNLFAFFSWIIEHSVWLLI